MRRQHSFISHGGICDTIWIVNWKDPTLRIILYLITHKNQVWLPDVISGNAYYCKFQEECLTFLFIFTTETVDCRIRIGD